MNKKYYFLTEAAIRQKLIVEQKSMAQAAAEWAEEYKLEKINVAGSLRFLVYKYFSKTELSLMGKERALHKNTKK